MSTSILTWEAIRPAPVMKQSLIEPEATDRFAPRPWLHWPPGAAFLVIACVAMMFVAAFQTGVETVRRDGLRAGLQDGIAGIEESLPVPLPSFVKPAVHIVAGKPHRAHHRRAARLHLLLQESPDKTAWSTNDTPVFVN